VASTIFRVTVTREPGPSGNGSDPAVGAALARGAAALRSGVTAGAGATTSAPVTPAGVPTAVGGSAVVRGGPTGAPAVGRIRESLGDQVVSGPGGNGAGGARPGYTPSGARIGRNDPCWCGSGVKYKKCHGR
jgi:preprotein translocase subunit SecA